MFAQLKTFLNGDGVVEALKTEFDLDTVLAARTGLALTVPTMVANFSNWLADADSENWYRTTIRTVRPDSLADFTAVTAAQDYRDLGEHGLNVVLGQRRDEVVSLVAARAEIPERAAYGLLAATTWVVTVAISRFQGNASRADTAKAFADERQGLLGLGWEPWLDQAAPRPLVQTTGAAGGLTPTTDTIPLVSRATGTADVPQHRMAAASVATQAAPVAVAQPIATQDPIPAGGGRSGDRVWIWVAGILGLLLVSTLIVGSYLLGRMQPESAAASADPIGAATVPTGADTTDTTDGEVAAEQTEVQEAGPADGSGDDRPVIGTEAEQQSQTQADADDWPGGRGPVPDTAPVRRTLEIDPDGSLVLSGSAPNWELAQQVVRVAEGNYPVDGVVVTNELTWHPDAATSVRSGDAVIPQAASFETGSSELTADSVPFLDLAAAILNSSPSVYVVVTGHTDGLGDEATNVSLSADRVDTTVEYLLSKGVIPGQIVTAAAGEDDPTASNETVDGRQSNRRVELLFKNYLAPAIGEGL